MTVVLSYQTLNLTQTDVSISTQCHVLLIDRAIVHDGEWRPQHCWLEITKIGLHPPAQVQINLLPYGIISDPTHANKYVALWSHQRSNEKTKENIKNIKRLSSHARLL